MLKVFFFTLCIYLPHALANAHDEAEGPSQEYRVLKQLALNSGIKAAVVVKEGGHLIGRPFQVELRVRCEGASSDVLQWPVHDSFSVCDMSPESVKVNRQMTAVALKAKVADLAHYDQQINDSASDPEVRCHKQTHIKKFSLKSLCPKP